MRYMGAIDNMHRQSAVGAANMDHNAVVGKDTRELRRDLVAVLHSQVGTSENRPHYSTPYRCQRLRKWLMMLVQRALVNRKEHKLNRMVEKSVEQNSTAVVSRDMA